MKLTPGEILKRPAVRELVSGLEQLRRDGYLDEARQACDELLQSGDSTGADLQMRLLTAKAWGAIGEFQSARQVINEVVQQLERDTDAPRPPGDSMAAVRDLCGEADLTVVAVAGDSELGSRISALIYRPVELPSGDVGDYRRRGEFHAALGQFLRARRDFEAAVATGNAGGHVGWYERYQRALCYLHDGDQSAYRTAGNEIVARFQDSQNRDELHWTAWTCAVAPGAVDDYPPLIELARRGHELAPDDVPMTQAFGAALFRAGQHDEAVPLLTEVELVSAETNENSTPLYARWFLAMTHYKLGHEADARQWYDRAGAETSRTLADGKTGSGEPLPWNRRLTLELLRAEARAMIKHPSKITE